MVKLLKLPGTSEHPSDTHTAYLISVIVATKPEKPLSCDNIIRSWNVSIMNTSQS